MYDKTETTKNTFLKVLQTLFNIVALPITYHAPELNIVKIRDAYQDIFGEKFKIEKYQSITQANTQEVKNVIRVTRKYTVTPIANGVFAQVSVDEQFSNTLFSNQEVIYEFTLPLEAVITDLKLGNNLEFQGQIVPRGVALRTYQQEVRQQQDPALLEQVGPSQYRLRIFPVPPKTFNQTENMPQQRVMFSYIVAITPKGYPLPTWTKEQNIKGRSEAEAILHNKVHTIKDDQTTIPAPKTREEICEQKNQSH